MVGWRYGDTLTAADMEAAAVHAERRDCPQVAALMRGHASTIRHGELLDVLRKKLSGWWLVGWLPERYSTTLSVWTDEDGEQWYAEGHHSQRVMVSAAMKLEEHCGLNDEELGDLLPELERGTIDHYWVLITGEESGCVVPAGVPGATPNTQLTRG